MSQLLVASDASELVSAQHAMIAQMEPKIQGAMEEAKAAKEMLTTMQSQRLQVGSAKRMHRRATSRVAYLVKVKAALEAGYVMMPDMPGTTIAVRTDRIGPSSPAARWRKGSSFSVPDESPNALPVGEGRYVSPRQQIISEQRDGTDWQGKPTKDQWSTAIALRDPDGLDRRFMRPEVMTRTVAAMAHNIFDEVGTVVPQSRGRRRNRDPIVLGRIVDNQSGACCAFLIAWFVDPVRDI